MTNAYLFKVEEEGAEERLAEMQEWYATEKDHPILVEYDDRHVYFTIDVLSDTIKKGTFDVNFNARHQQQLKFARHGH